MEDKKPQVLNITIDLSNTDVEIDMSDSKFSKANIKLLTDKQVKMICNAIRSLK